MPIEIFHTEQGIYCSRWSGVVSFQDIQQVQQQGQELVSASGDTAYFLITVLEPDTRIPMDIRLLGQFVRRNVGQLGMLVVNSSPAVTLIGATVMRMRQMIYERFDDYEEALERARMLLAAHETQEHQP